MAHISNRKKPTVPFWIILLVLATVFFYNSENGPYGGSVTRTSIPGSTAPLTVTPDSGVYIPPTGIYSPFAILVRLDDRAILMETRSEDKIYPASLTKIMTVIVAMENLKDLDERIELGGDSVFRDLHSADASMAGFQPGEEVRAIDLLYGAMLPSGAECCIGLANEIAGSERKFVRMMNQKAADLNLENTHFVNTTGLHDDDHYTTVKDVSVLLCYALQNSTFRQIFTTTRYSTLPTNKHPDGITFYSTLQLDDPRTCNGRILGGKTGYTDEAGLCLASLAAESGLEYVLVTAGAKGDRTEQYSIRDAFTVYNSLGEA